MGAARQAPASTSSTTSAPSEATVCNMPLLAARSIAVLANLAASTWRSSVARAFSNASTTSCRTHLGSAVPSARRAAPRSFSARCMRATLAPAQNSSLSNPDQCRASATSPAARASRVPARASQLRPPIANASALDQVSRFVERPAGGID